MRRGRLSPLDDSADRARLLDPAALVHVIEAPTSERLKQLEAHWINLAARFDGKPRRADLELGELKRHLPSIFLLDVLDGGADFRFRLVGTAVVEKLGRDSTGKRWSEIDYGGAAEPIRRTWQYAIGQNAPTYVAGHLAWRPDRDWLGFECLHLPLYADGEVNMLLCAVDWV